MKTIKLGKHELEIYDSIDELPVIRFHKFNKFLLVDSGIGSDLADLDNHLERAKRYIKTKPEMAVAELENLRQNVYFIQSELSPKHLAFCVLVKKFDGVECNDLSTEGLKSLHGKISGLANKEVLGESAAVKKKVDTELSTYFPSVFDDAAVKEYFDYLKKRAVLMLDAIISGEEKKKDLDEVTGLLLTFAKPENFQGPDGVEVNYDKQFESMCLLLSKKLNVDPKKFTVLEYYNAFEFLKKEAKSGKK